MAETEFISTKNKAMIWQLLMEANAFINIPDTYFETIKTIYEQIIIEISNLTNMSLTDRNKMLMSKMIEKIRYFSNEHIQKPLQEVSVKVSEEFENKSDNIDKPFNDSELSVKLSELMTDRLYDTLPPLPKSLENNDNKVEPRQDNQEKKVSFVPSTENIISKLKTVNPKNKPTDNNSDVNTEILNTLKTISINQQLTLKNQDKILQLLSKE